MTASREYEAILIADPGIHGEALDRLKAQFGEIVSRHGGSVQETSVLGKRRLSYRIGKHTEGNYLQIRMQIPPSSVEGLRRAASLIEPVVRLMMVSRPSVPPSGGTAPAFAGEGRPSAPPNPPSRPRENEQGE